MSKRERIRCFLRHTLRILVMVACLQGIVHEAKAQDGLIIPTTHPRLWWTPERLQQARTWWSSHSFTPSSGDAQGNAFAYLMTGNTSYCQTAISSLMNFTIAQSELDGVASDNYRWNDWVPVVFDWCHDLVDLISLSTFISRYNNYTSIMIGEKVGAAPASKPTIITGVSCGTNSIGLSRPTARTPMAQTFLDNGLVTRWQNGVLPYFASGESRRRAARGYAYGRYDVRVHSDTVHLDGPDGRGSPQSDRLVQGGGHGDEIYATSLAPISRKYIYLPVRLALTSRATAQPPLMISGGSRSVSHTAT